MRKEFADELMRRHTTRTGNLGGAISAHDVAEMIADAVEITTVRLVEQGDATDWRTMPRANTGPAQTVLF